MLPAGYSLVLANLLAAIRRTGIFPLKASLGEFSNGLAGGRSSAIVHEDGQITAGLLSSTNCLDYFGVHIDRRPQLIELFLPFGISMHQVQNLILQGVVIPGKLLDHFVLPLLIGGDGQLRHSLSEYPRRIMGRRMYLGKLNTLVDVFNWLMFALDLGAR